MAFQSPNAKRKAAEQRAVNSGVLHSVHWRFLTEFNDGSNQTQEKVELTDNAQKYWQQYQENRADDSFESTYKSLFDDTPKKKSPIKKSKHSSSTPSLKVAALAPPAVPPRLTQAQQQQASMKAQSHSVEFRAWSKKHEPQMKQEVDTWIKSGAAEAGRKIADPYTKPPALNPFTIAHNKLPKHLRPVPLPSLSEKSTTLNSYEDKYKRKYEVEMDDESDSNRSRSPSRLSPSPARSSSPNRSSSPHRSSSPTKANKNNKDDTSNNTVTNPILHIAATLSQLELQMIELTSNSIEDWKQVPLPAPLPIDPSLIEENQFVTAEQLQADADKKKGKRRGTHLSPLSPVPSTPLSPSTYYPPNTPLSPLTPTFSLGGEELMVQLSPIPHSGKYSSAFDRPRTSSANLLPSPSNTRASLSRSPSDINNNNRVPSANRIPSANRTPSMNRIPSANSRLSPLRIPSANSRISRISSASSNTSRSSISNQNEDTERSQAQEEGNQAENTPPKAKPLNTDKVLERYTRVMEGYHPSPTIENNNISLSIDEAIQIEQQKFEQYHSEIQQCLTHQETYYDIQSEYNDSIYYNRTIKDRDKQLFNLKESINSEKEIKWTDSEDRVCVATNIPSYIQDFLLNYNPSPLESSSILNNNNNNNNNEEKGEEGEEQEFKEGSDIGEDNQDLDITDSLLNDSTSSLPTDPLLSFIDNPRTNIILPHINELPNNKYNKIIFTRERRKLMNEYNKLQDNRIDTQLFTYNSPYRMKKKKEEEEKLWQQQLKDSAHSDSLLVNRNYNKRKSSIQQQLNHIPEKIEFLFNKESSIIEEKDEYGFDKKKKKDNENQHLNPLIPNLPTISVIKKAHAVLLSEEKLRNNNNNNNNKQKENEKKMKYSSSNKDLGSKDHQRSLSSKKPNFGAWYLPSSYWHTSPRHHNNDTIQDIESAVEYQLDILKNEDKSIKDKENLLGNTIPNLYIANVYKHYLMKPQHNHHHSPTHHKGKSSLSTSPNRSTTSSPIQPNRSITSSPTLHNRSVSFHPSTNLNQIASPSHKPSQLSVSSSTSTLATSPSSPSKTPKSTTSTDSSKKKISYALPWLAQQKREIYEAKQIRIPPYLEGVDIIKPTLTSSQSHPSLHANTKGHTKDINYKPILSPTSQVLANPTLYVTSPTSTHSRPPPKSSHFTFHSRDDDIHHLSKKVKSLEGSIGSSMVNSIAPSACASQAGSLSPTPRPTRPLLSNDIGKEIDKSQQSNLLAFIMRTNQEVAEENMERPLTPSVEHPEDNRVFHDLSADIVHHPLEIGVEAVEEEYIEPTQAEEEDMID